MTYFLSAGVGRDVLVFTQFSHLESANNPVVIQRMFVVVPGLSSVQVESVEPVFKVAILSLQLLVVHLHVNTHIICICTYVTVRWLFFVSVNDAHQQLVHFCFNRSFLGAVCSLTLLLVLGVLLLFVLFLRLGAFQKKVIGFDI